MTAPTVGDHEGLRRILDREYRPDLTQVAPRAAVAAVFRPTDDGRTSELLFIQRATKASDPWSGQMAFPGGREEDDDPSPRHTAMRETVEEVGLDLSGAAFLGSLSELDGGRANNRRVIVSAHAWWLDGPRPDLTPNYEVADVVWVSLAELADRNRYIEYLYQASGMHFPGIQLDRQDQVIWGLTLRFLSDLFERLEHPFIAIDELPGTTTGGSASAGSDLPE
ncbi:MAG: CoA pyrophosphatase [Actinomycetota bacterium]